MADRTTLPLGFRFQLGIDVHRCADGVTLFGGSHGKTVRLKGAAPGYLDSAGVIEVTDKRSELLARMLSDRGLAHPAWSDDPFDLAETAHRVAQLSVVVPVLNRTGDLDRLLSHLCGADSGTAAGSLRVIVVDDGSADAEAVRAVADRHRATLLRHESPRGPAAARNAGLAAADTELVALVDSDIVLGAHDLLRLARHFDDYRVGAAAPRVLGLIPDGSAVTRYEAACSSLDLGPLPALVRPHARVSYVPTATVMVRRCAVVQGFDPTMRVAEDVDLMWRLARDWHVRYDPSITVRHDHRTSMTAWIRRKAFYGTGAAPLATRHGSAVAPMVLTEWTAALSIAMLAQRRWSIPLAVTAIGFGFSGTYRRLQRTAPAPRLKTAREVAPLMAMALNGAAAQSADAVIRHYVPLTILALPFSSRARHVAAASLILRGLSEWHRVRPELDPARFLALHAADNAGYGLGLWRGALAERSMTALRPVIRRVPAPGDPPLATSPLSHTPTSAIRHGRNRPDRKVVHDEHHLV